MDVQSLLRNTRERPPSYVTGAVNQLADTAWGGGPFLKYWQAGCDFWRPLLSNVGAFCAAAPSRELPPTPPRTVQIASYLRGSARQSRRVAARRR
eukprot:4301312-Pyramimonas_sp.AAC.1